jgi:hypothetical protein
LDCIPLIGAYHLAKNTTANRYVSMHHAEAKQVTHLSQESADDHEWEQTYQ